MKKKVRFWKNTARRRGVKYYKNRFLNMSIRKRLNFTFIYIGFIALFIVAIGLFNIKTIESMLNRFYAGPYKIEENVLRSQVAMKTIENNIYRAYFTKKEELCKEYIAASEVEYDKLEECITELSNVSILLEGENLEYINGLQLELEKGNRYRTQILESANVFNQDKIYSIYKNDYVPILNHMLTELDEIEMFSALYGKDYMKKANEKVSNSIVTFILLIIAGAASCIYLLVMTERSITKPITEIKAAMLEISKGNLGVDIYFSSEDEMGILCEAVRETLRKLKGYITNITYIVKQLEEKNMTVRAVLEYEGDFSPIKTSLDNAVESFQEMLTVIFQAAEEITKGADEIAQTAKIVADGGMEQSTANNQLSEQINRTVVMVGKNVSDAVSVHEISKNAVNAAQQGKEQMDSLVNAMEVIALHSGRISLVIQVIEEIAEQTNLLSLNASIEAARAGNAGKGFGVVANEIGKLAQESRHAVQSTSELINSTIHAIREGVDLAKQTASNFEKIVDASTQTNQVMERMANNSRSEEQQLNESMMYLQQITTITKSNCAAARVSSAMSEAFRSQSEKLEIHLQEYKLT